MTHGCDVRGCAVCARDSLDCDALGCDALGRAVLSCNTLGRVTLGCDRLSCDVLILVVLGCGRTMPSCAALGCITLGVWPGLWADMWADLLIPMITFSCLCFAVATRKQQLASVLACAYTCPAARAGVDVRAFICRRCLL